MPWYPRLSGAFVADYEHAKKVATLRIISRPGMTMEQLQDLSRRADKALKSLRKQLTKEGE